MAETAYLNVLESGGRLDHCYGDHVHILSDSWALTALARLGHPDTDLPTVHRLLIACYRRLLHAATEQLPAIAVSLNTRMTTAEPAAHFHGTILDPESQAVVVDIARGGMIPGHLFQTELMDIMRPESVRVDHLYMQRRVDPKTGGVTGVDFYGSKIGGPVRRATVFVPDPMGATGASVCHVLAHYKSNPSDQPKKLVTCHLIVTPEYLKRVSTEHPGTQIYALRVDRGLSPADVLTTPPGTHWEQEKGLNNQDYIIPGAGGLGEVINNAFV
jgi:uracil phosphoribosyltransferase